MQQSPEQWAELEGAPDTALAPVPEWEDHQPEMPAGGRATADLPQSSDAGPGADAGRSVSDDAAAAGGSPALPLSQAVEVTGPGEVTLSLTPDTEFLNDPETEYPVVIDPELDWQFGFDTWVQHGYSTDQSGSSELRLGTFDGGASVARSFLSFDLSGIRHRQILGASLFLWEWHAWSCEQAPWEVWSTNAAGPGTRIDSQPTWWQRYTISHDTMGGSACADGWVGANVTSLIQEYSTKGFGLVGVGLKAQHEQDNRGWKRFNSAQAGDGVPTLWVQWNSAPTLPTGLTLDASTDTGILWTTRTTPQLSAVAQDVDGDALHMVFQVLRSGSSTVLWEGTANGVLAGQVGRVTVPKGILAEGVSYVFRAGAFDGRLWTTGWAYSRDFMVDLIAPAAPDISSTDYPADGRWHKDKGMAGAFTLSLKTADPTLAAYEWGLNKAPTTRHTGTSPLSVTPTAVGRQVLQVRSVDKAGHRSPIVSYVFYVGRGGLTSPREGSEVVRRVRLTVEAEPVFTHVRFDWRRGPDSATVAPIALPALSQADGRPLSSWSELAGLGGYATWDAGLTLGHVPGPVQVRAVLATSASGAGLYEGPWVTVTVSPDAQNAGSSSLGPGDVNLLTGDYSLSSTDVEEFGLALGRTASSRNPRAGLEPQVEILTAAQQSMSAISGFTAGATTLSRATDRFHTATPAGGDSLKVVSAGGSNDSFAQVTMSDLRKGATYRLSGWMYVPASTGLTPQHADWGLRLVGYWQEATGVWQQGKSAVPTKVDMWQQVSVDFTVPANATSGGRVRLYNGFSTAGKAVYFDDLTLRELWAPLGPEWQLGTADETTGTAYSHIAQPYPDVVALHLAGGGQIWFTGAAGNEIWWPQPGAESLTLKRTGDGRWSLTELDGTVSEFARQSGASNSQLVMTSPAVASGQTRLVYQNVDGRVRLHRLVAPIEPGVDGWPGNQTACTTAVPAAGCEVMELVYATSTTATSTALGSYKERLARVLLHSTPAVGAAQTQAVPVAEYRYDGSGRLREIWDPRISPALKTMYEYDDAGRVTTLTPPAELPWTFSYGTGGSRAEVGTGDLVDRSSGRLLRVTRASLVPGSLSQTGESTTSTVVYDVPLTRSAGGPYDLHPDALASWAQTSAPTDATAIFGPEHPQSQTTADVTTPGADGYGPATVHYLDSSGREVNTASPAGRDAPGEGYIDTAEYDEFGNVVRTLDASSRLLALGKHASAAADLVQLRLHTEPSTAVRAIALSTLSTYGLEGIDLLRQRGPLVRLAVGNDPDDERLVHDLTTYAYDEGKPDGLAYHLVTTQTDGLLLAGSSSEELVDVEVTKNVYDPIDGASPIGPSSGWKIGSPTAVVFDAGPGGAALTARVRYDEQGRVAESRKVGSDGRDAGTNAAVYYSVAANPTHPECGAKAAYAGLPCKNLVAGAVTGHDPARMAGQLPVRTVTDYNRYGSVVAVTESATGPVNGATATQSRTTTTEYDAADRVLSVVVTGGGPGTTAQPMMKTVNVYDPTSGDVTEIRGVDAATGDVRSTVRKTFDQLGRMTRYEDGSGGRTDSVFDKLGRPVEVTDSTGSSTAFTYDPAQEPRGFVTSVEDSVGGRISASYGPDGQIVRQVLPGGLELRIGYDANQAPISRTYVRASDREEIATSSVVENSAGQWVRHTTPGGTRQYDYDRLGRLTDVQDTMSGSATCTWRKYAYNDRGGRLSLSSAASPTSTCVDPTLPVAADDPAPPTVTGNSYRYDSADRLVPEAAVGADAWVYDPLGRITSAPVRGSPDRSVSNAFYANDLIASQTIAGVARMGWSLDAIGRFSSYTSEAWAAGADGVPAWQEAVTKVNHYDSDSDSPAWVVEDASLPGEITRYVDGLDGNLAMQTGKTGERVLQLVDLHGDVMSTLPINDDQDQAAWAQVRYQVSDEFGDPLDVDTGASVVTDGAAPGKDGRYGWLGGKQRSADALAGVLLMGVRLYDPGTGRFWSPDPSPGGNATAYDYCAGDPVNCTDLDGHWGVFGKLFKKVVKKVAKVAELASNIPGPIGAASAAISAGAYAASGNRGKALEMAVSAAAAMVPGGRAAVKTGFALARAGGRVSAKVGQSLNKARKGCSNSFTPETGVLMGDGTTKPISDVQVGDVVAARDPESGELTAQPVLNVIVGHGDKHLIGVATSRGPPAADQTKAPQDRDTWIATANHPIWVEGRGWTDAEKLRAGEFTLGATGEPRVVTDVIDYGRLAAQTVFNLTVANVHTFIVGGKGEGSLVHNASCPRLTHEFAGNLRQAYAKARAAKKQARADGFDAYINPARSGRYNGPNSVRSDVVVVTVKRSRGGRFVPIRKRPPVAIHHIIVKTGKPIR